MIRILLYWSAHTFYLPPLVAVCVLYKCYKNTVLCPISIQGTGLQVLIPCLFVRQLTVLFIFKKLSTHLRKSRFRQNILDCAIRILLSTLSRMLFTDHCSVSDLWIKRSARSPIKWGTTIFRWADWMISASVLCFPQDPPNPLLCHLIV